MPIFHKKDARLIWVEYFFITLLKHLTKSLFNGRIFLQELKYARCYESYLFVGDFPPFNLWLGNSTHLSHPSPKWDIMNSVDLVEMLQNVASYQSLNYLPS